MVKKTNFLFILSIFICLIKITNILSNESVNYKYQIKNNKIEKNNEENFIKNNLKLNPEDLSKITEEIIKKYLERKRIFIITPYVEAGLRIPFWAYKGLMDKISPFTNTKCANLETFNLEEKDSFIKALYLKPLDEINTPFAENYGLTMTIGNTCNNTLDLRNSIAKLLEKLHARNTNKKNYDHDFKDDNKFLDKVVDLLHILVRNETKSDIDIYKDILDIIDNSKNLINNFVTNKNKNVILTPNQGQVLCPLYLANISKFLFIKNATDNYIQKHTENSLKKYKQITKSKLSINKLTDELINKLETNSLSLIEKNLNFLINKRDYLIDDLKKKFDEVIKNDEFIKGTNEKMVIRQFINKTIKSIIENEKKLNITKNKEEQNEINKNLEKSRTLLMNIRRILNNLNHNTADNTTFLDTELDDDFKILIHNLKESGLLPKRTPKNNLDEDINKIIGKKIAEYNKKDLEVLVGKLKKLKRNKESKKILKKLQIEDIKWWIPYNFRFGILGTQYINRRIGINIDLSFSFSITGMTKSLFLPEDFLQNAVYYLLKLHEPIVSGRILESDKKIEDILYAVPELSVPDLLLDDFLDKLVKIKHTNSDVPIQDNIIGSKYGPNPVKKTDAFSNYLKVININNNSQDCLCDIDVSLQQINFCIKLGVCFNLNNLEVFKIDKNHLLDNFINEISLNCGLYFNWQKLKLEVTENKKYYEDKYFDENIKKDCVLQDVLEDAVIDSLNNFGIENIKNKDKLNDNIEKMFYNILCKSFDSSIAPKNNKMIGLCNNVFENEIAEICCKDVFNTFTLRPVLDLKYKIITPIGLTFMCGCEFILLNPFNIYSNLKKFIKSIKNENIKKNMKNFKISNDFELLPYISIGFSYVF